jgi:hypothetical protein
MKTAIAIFLRKILFLIGISAVILLLSASLAFTQETEELPLELGVDLGSRWTQVYDWAIDKEVRPASADLSMGQSITFDYQIVVSQAYVQDEFYLYGSIYVYNPMPITRNFTISTVIGGSFNAPMQCFDSSGEETFSVRGESTSDCYFDLHQLSGREFDGEEVVVTVTTSDNPPGVTSTASATVDWVDEPVARYPLIETVTVVDDAQEPFVDAYWPGATNGIGFSNPQTYVCSSDPSLYENGQYSVSFSNTAYIEETGISDTATVTVNCFSSPVEYCSYDAGYWGNHGEDGPAPYDDAWRNIGSGGENSIFFLSGQSYYEVLSSPPRGNPYYILARQYIAAKLNVLNGATPPQDVIFAIAFGDEIFFTYGPDDEVPSHIPDLMRDFAATLEDFNNGRTGPGACGR